MMSVRTWLHENIGLSILFGVIVAYVIGMIVQIATILKKRRDKELPHFRVLSDAAAAVENMRDVFKSTTYSFDCLAVSGGTLVRMWTTQIEECARRGVRFRFLLADMSDPHCQAFAKSIRKDTALLKSEVDDVVQKLNNIKQRVPSAKIEHRFYAGHSPLYSMWIRDNAEAGASNIQVHLYGGLGNGPIVRSDNAQLHTALSQEFEEAWKLGTTRHD